MVRALTSIWLSGMLLLATGCAGQNPQAAGMITLPAEESVESVPAERILANGSGSLDEMARRFLDALARADEGELKSMSVDRAEFERVFWPDLPASAPDSGLSLDFVWNQYKWKAARGLERLLEDHGGRQYEYVSVGFTGESRSYPHHVIHSGSFVEVLDPDGATRRLRLFGSVVEQAGRYKIYGYVVN